MRRTSTPFALTALAAGALLVAGCGTSTTATASTASDADITAGVTYAESQLAMFTEDPAFTLQADAFPMKDIAGKTIVNIPSSSENPYVVSVDAEAQKVAESYGATWVEYTNQGLPAQWSAGIEQAVNQQADLVILSQGQSPTLLAPALQKAKDAGIPVLSTHIFLRGEPLAAEDAALVDAYTDAPLAQANRLTVDWMISKTQGKGDVLVITSNEVPPAEPEVAAMQDEISSHCPACTVKVVNVPVVDWATKIQTEVQSALTADPGINFILPIYDSMSLYAQSGVTAAGKTGQVQISSVNGTPAVLKLIQDGDTMTMDVGESIPWLAWATMDQAGRLLTGTAPVADGAEETPLKLITKDNIGDTGTPPQPDKGYGTAYVDGYTALWGQP